MPDDKTATVATAKTTAKATAKTPTVLLICALIVTVAASLLFAIVEIFLVPTRIGATEIPIAAALAFASNWGLGALALWWTGKNWSALIPCGIWFVLTLFATAPTSTGSVLILMTLNGLLFLLGGTAGAIIIIVKTLFPPRRGTI